MKTETKKLESQIGKFNQLITAGQATLLIRNSAKSGWSVGQHLDHLLKVCNAILTFTLKAKPVKERLTLRGFVILTIGRMPRGRAKAPDAVVGVETSAQNLLDSLTACRNKLSALSSNPATLNSAQPLFKHHLFGGLSTKNCIRFLEIHNHHHLLIIAELMAQQ